MLLIAVPVTLAWLLITLAPASTRWKDGTEVSSSHCTLRLVWRFQVECKHKTVLFYVLKTKDISVKFRHKIHSLIWHLVCWIKKKVHCSLLCWPFPMESAWQVSTSVLPSERKHSLPGMTTITLLAWLGKNLTICLTSAIICFPDELIESMGFLMLCVNYTFQMAACWMLLWMVCDNGNRSPATGT